MPVNYDAMKKEYPKLKAALTRAKNSKDPKKIIATVDLAFARFEEIGYPDAWSTWENAKRDAEWELQRKSISTKP